MPTFWTDEDGDTYYSTGHQTREHMVKAAIEYERETVKAEPVENDFHEEAMPRHYWILWISDEHGESVSEGTPGGEKTTSLMPCIDWDEIEARGDAGERC